MSISLLFTRLGSFLAAILILCAEGYAQRWEWQNVNLQGMGFVTGIVAHPTEADVVYARTDVGGVFRWEEASEAWTPLMDGQGIGYSIASVAVDPEDAQVLYAAIGHKEEGTLYRSADRGDTWSPLALSVYMEGNGAWRHAGERLSVSDNLLYYGSRRDGLWQSIDGGAQWRQIDPAAVPVGSDAGHAFTLIHPADDRIAYVGVQGEGIYQTTNSGDDWSLLEGGPEGSFRPVHGTLAQDGSLYVTYADGPAAGAGGQVYRYSGSGSLQLITPGNRTNQGFAGISVRVDQPEEVLTFQWNFGPQNGIHRSVDGGNQWSPLRFDTDSNVTEPGYYPTWTSFTNAGQIMLDPTRGNRAWMTTGFAVYQSDNINDSVPQWRAVNQNLEEFVCIVLKAPPAQPEELVLGVADMVGMTLTAFDEVPDDKFFTNEFGIVSGISYCASQPNNIAFVGSSQFGEVTPYTGLSRDGGVTWSEFPTIPTNLQNGNIAFSSQDPQVMVWAPMSESNLGLPTDTITVLLHYTTDGGQSWQPAAGAPSRVESLRQYWFGSESLVADPVESSTFYLYDRGTVYRSEDNGANWSAVGTIPVDWFQVIMKARPGSSKELYFTAKNEGALYRSVDGGASWNVVDSLLDCRNFAFGKAAQDSDTLSLYAFGRIDGEEGIFVSHDVGTSWEALNTEGIPLERINTLEASQDTFGKLYFGTGGRGAFVGTVSAPASRSFTVRARGIQGTEQIEIRLNDQPISERITLSTKHQTYTVTSDQTEGTVRVAFVNDKGRGHDVKVDWLQVEDVRRQAEDRKINTGAWKRVCGGGRYTENLQCNGYIDFGSFGSEADTAADESPRRPRPTLKPHLPLVYPNPTRDRLFLQSEEPLDITLYDPQGHVVLHQSETTSPAEVDVSQLPEGIYLLRTQSVQATHVQKVIIGDAP